MQRQTRVLAVHDISCVGRCSLTVALPVLSAAGVETSVLPTAVLSTHTGGFTNMTFRDRTEDVPGILAHWKSLDLHFDAIYTGYLGSLAQAALIEDLFSQFGGEDTRVVVDPVMGDEGRLYAGISEKMPDAMRRLCQRADLIVPNLTEACLMLGQPYAPGPYQEEYIKEILLQLSGITKADIVLTGVMLDEQTLGAAVYQQKNELVEYAMTDRIPGYFHGTGDLFASALLGAWINGVSLGKAAQIAAQYTKKSIEATLPYHLDPKFGVCFEKEIPFYLQKLHL